MPSLQIKTNIQLSDLLNSVEQLSIKDLDQVINQLVSLKIKRLRPQFSKIEATLVKQINKRLSKKKQKRYDELTQKRLDEQLTNTEHQELAKLIEAIEEIEMRKAQALFTLSQIRGVAPAKLMGSMFSKVSSNA